MSLTSMLCTGTIGLPESRKCRDPDQNSENIREIGTFGQIGTGSDHLSHLGNTWALDTQQTDRRTTSTSRFNGEALPEAVVA